MFCRRRKQWSWAFVHMAVVSVWATGRAPLEEADFTGKEFRVLVTGFGPFLTLTENPTQAIVERLNDICKNVSIVLASSLAQPVPTARLRVCFEAKVLPVNRSGAMWTVQHLENQHAQHYHAVFHTGFEEDAKGLKLEVAAANLRANDTGADSHQHAMPGSPSLQVTTVDVGRLSLPSLDAAARPSQAALAKEQELWSRDPGRYYCNEVYYRTLNHIRSQSIVATTGALLPAMFIHVPRSTRSSLTGDAEVVEQVVAHTLWATYLTCDTPEAVCEHCGYLAAVGMQYATPSTTAAVAAAIAIVAGLIMSAAGAAILMAFHQTKARTTTALTEPLISPTVCPAQCRRRQLPDSSFANSTNTACNCTPSSSCSSSNVRNGSNESNRCGLWESRL